MSRITIVCLSFLALCLLVSTPVQAETNVLFIVDVSGSMKEKVDGQSRMSVAKKVLGETLNNMPEDVRIGLLAYGHRRAKDCTDIELVSPLGGDDAQTIGKTIDGFNAKGETPIAEALRKAVKSFNAFKGQDNSIILVTDGLEECKGDPCAAADELKSAELDITVNIVGFTLGEEEGKALKCVTEATGGKYYTAANADALTDALKDVQQKVQETAIVAEAKPDEFDGDVLADKNGARLEYAPSDKWSWLNKDHEDFVGKHRPSYGGEAVWSFKDGSSATFDQIDVLVPGQNGYTLKEFEILAADELEGPYRSLGEFEVKNIKMMPAGWQGFKFPETTAHYVKIIFKSSHGSYIGGNALRLIGKINDDSESKSAEAVPEGDDILNPKFGGTLEYAPSGKWVHLTKEREKFTTPTYTGAGVWSFKDRKDATFDNIQVYVGAAGGYTLKDFEVFVADGIDGPYRSVGEFTVRNFKVMPDGWQIFHFPAVTGHFVKVEFKTSYGSYIGGNPIRILGKVDESSESSEAPVQAEGKNLIAEAQGGSLLYGHNDEWAKLNQEKGERATVRNGEGVWSFDGEKPAIVTAVQVYVPKKDSYNLKEFEVLVGDDGPTGDFRSLGTFTAPNHKVMPDGWQTFTVPKVEARYVKLKTISGHGSYISMYGFRVFGELQE